MRATPIVASVAEMWPRRCGTVALTTFGVADTDRQTDRLKAHPNGQTTDGPVSNATPPLPETDHTLTTPHRHHRRHTREPTRTRKAGHTARTLQGRHSTSSVRHVHAHIAPSHASDTGTRRDPPSDARAITHRHNQVQQRATHRLREYAGTFSPANASQLTPACASTAQHHPQHPANRPKHKGHARTQAHNARAHTTSAS